MKSIIMLTLSPQDEKEIHALIRAVKMMQGLVGIAGAEHNQKYSAMFPLRSGNAVGGLSNVVLATQWQQPPGGLPIAAEGGKLAIQTILKKERRKGHKVTT